MAWKLLAKIALLFVPLLALVSCNTVDAVNTASRIGFEQVERGLSYGSLARQKYDIYRPANAKPDAPVLLFIYGGSWDSGKRAMYEFVGNEMAQRGIVTVVADYRIYPQVRFPTFVNDAALAFAKVKSTLSPNQPVFIMGHSAGAQIGSLLTVDKTYLRKQGLDVCKDVAGFIGLAGPYDFLPLNEDRYKRIFPKPTRAASQPINFASRKTVPSLLLHGLDDETVESKDTTIMANAMLRAGTSVTAKLYPGVDHVNIVGAIAPFGSALAATRKDTVSFIKTVAGKGYPGCS